MNNIKDLASIPYIGVHEFRPHGKLAGKTCCVGYAKDEILPWALGYCGSSHYFRTIQELSAYAAGRGFIRFSMIDALTDICISKIENA